MFALRAAYGLFLATAGVRAAFRERVSLPHFRRDLANRLGLRLPQLAGAVWFHGEGVGEFRAAAPLFDRVRATGRPLALTTGRPRVADWLAEQHPDALVRPTPFLAGRWFRQVRPALLVALEFAEAVPPHLLAAARARGVPVAVVNGRALPARKPTRYRLADWIGLSSWCRRQVELSCQQSAAGATGTPGVTVVTGSLKLAVAARTPQPSRPARPAPAVIAACLHPEECRLIGVALRELRARCPGLTVAVAPQGAVAPLGERVIAGLGGLDAEYAAADVVILGGSFVPGLGGHNPLEALACGAAVVCGPFVEPTLGEPLRQLDALTVVPAEQLAATVAALLADPDRRAAQVQRAQHYIAAHADAAERTWQALRPLLHDRPAATPRRPLLHALARRVTDSSLGQRLLAQRADRLTDWDAVATRCRRPRSILCLGNGPSSADPALRREHWDALFRVNWRWRGHGRWQHPDVVFTGDSRTLRECPNALIGFRTARERAWALLHHHEPRRVPCFCLEELPTPLNRPWPARPSNGVAMLAAAVALRPERLLIAGLDLFADPAGPYGDDRSGANEYAAPHDRATEVMIVRTLLAEYAGEVMFFGSTLRAALASDAPREGICTASPPVRVASCGRIGLAE